MAKMTAEQLLGGTQPVSPAETGVFRSESGYQPYKPPIDVNDPVSAAISRSNEELEKPKTNPLWLMLKTAGKATVGAIQKIPEVNMELAKGALKGIGSTFAGALAVGEKAAGALTGTESPLGEALTGVKKPFGEQIQESLLTPKGTAEKVGFGSEQVGEFFTKAPMKILATSLGNKFGKTWGVIGRIIGSGVDYASKRAAQKATYEDIPDDLMVGSAGEAISVLGEGALKKASEKLYQSALKPSTSIGAKKTKEIVQTGLNEKLLLTQHAKDIVAGKIDALDDALETAIQAAEDSGKTVSASEIKPFIDSAKKFFGTQADVKAGATAVSSLDDMYSGFVSKYGDELPPTLAQQIKRNTMKLIRDSYGELSTVAKEGQKDVAAGLRVGVEKATSGMANTINERLKRLIELDEVLDKAVTRLGNSNLFSLTSSVVGTSMAGGGLPGMAAAGLSSIGTSASFKSAAAIVMNELGKISAKTGVPIQILLGKISDEITKSP